MLKFYSKTSIGYSHLKAERRCQDFSCCYHDEEKTVITACDGHGGKIYIRSDLGSKFAAKATLSVLTKIENSLFYKYSKDEIADKIKLEILCEWNALVEKNLSDNRFSKKETENLTDEEKRALTFNPEKAYGTTLNGVMAFGNKLICVNIGDGGIFTLKKGAVEPVFDDGDDETVANLTYSMCGEDAYKHINVKILDFREYDGVIACTDGVLNPYRSLPNFTESFVKPITLKLIAEDYGAVTEFIEKLGNKLGVGDDVSFSAIIKADVSARRYKG